MKSNTLTSLIDGCPADDVLVAFKNGGVDEPDLDSIAGHLDTCEVCLSKLDTLPEWPVVSAIRHGWEVLETERARGLGVFEMEIAAAENLGSPTVALEDLPTQIGSYRILGLLGKGGMGRVYRAVHDYLETPVALKVLNTRNKDDSGKERFLMEMRAIGKVDSPYVVRAAHAGVENNEFYIAMELVEGFDLGVTARCIGRLPVADACEIMRQTALGLAAIHKENLIHRDIKPNNLLLASDGKIKILDLGLARWSPEAQRDHGLTSANVLLGTFDYMSPEQAEGKGVQASCDLYSLGCTFYHLLAGRPPFATRAYVSMQQKLRGHCFDLPEDLRKISKTIPSEVAELVARLLAKDPGQRPASAAEVAALLAPWTEKSDLVGLASRVTDRRGPRANDDTPISLQVEGTCVEPLPAPVSVASKTATRGIVALLIAAVLLAAGGGSFLLYSGRKQADPPAAPPGADLPTINQLASAPLLDVSSGGPALKAPKPVEEPVSIGQTPSMFYEDLAPEEVIPGLRYTLLNREPERLYWVQDATSSVHHDPLRKSLAAQCTDLGLLSLGSVSTPSYTLRFDLYQPKWTGGFGVFWGYQECIYDDQPSHTFHRLDVRLVGLDEQGNRRYALVRARVFAVPNARADIDLVAETSGGGEIVVERGKTAEIELKIGATGLIAFRCSGEPLKSICETEINKEYTAESNMGKFGVYLILSNVSVPYASIVVDETFLPQGRPTLVDAALDTKEEPATP
ncbi:serine/threonine protein kinase [Lignipirellula cremea]|uniref:Serine/threonine-protein kinase PrkC n=1 Tax=Lignipirellula cremea TaxID=2528010 RepID=A0A518E3K9_9BACT|nr:serine/threonine-protein kinase [Lignipirellula cremea]QDU98678.1 Serine/threonine-protein kinase PrkC [Lignipirellula cremea]